MSRAARVLLLTSLVLWGCGGDTATPQRSRVEGVKAVATPDITRFCDATWPVQLGPPLTLPRVEPARPGTVVPQLATDRFVWVNLWATWCGPCRREMPVVLKLAERLQAEGVNVDVWFVSIDEAEDYLARLARQLREEGQRVLTYVEIGPAAANILRKSDELNTVFVLMATHGRSGMNRLFFGSVAMEVLRRGDHPVMLIRPLGLIRDQVPAHAAVPAGMD